MKKNYSKPMVVRHSIEMESQILSASVISHEQMGEVKTTGHELNHVDISSNSDFGWNDSQWQ